MRSRCHRQQWLFVLMLTVFLGSTLYAEGDGGYIYGKITLQNRNVYQGVIRWGDEEAFWDDMFNSTKYDDVFDYYDISPRDVQSIDSARKSRRGRRFWDFNFWDDNKLIHTFKCRFGDIQKLRLRGSKSVYVTFKNGDINRQFCKTFSKLVTPESHPDILPSFLIVVMNVNCFKLAW